MNICIYPFIDLVLLFRLIKSVTNQIDGHLYYDPHKTPRLNSAKSTIKKALTTGTCLIARIGQTSLFDPQIIKIDQKEEARKLRRPQLKWFVCLWQVSRSVYPYPYHS